MPNGGSDCCFNCPWYSGDDCTDSGRCELREAPITISHWTYCNNFPMFWTEPPAEKPPINGPIYASGIFEGGYSRIPWNGKHEPRTYASGVCSITGVRFTQGISVYDDKAGTTLYFATNQIYCRWLKGLSPPGEQFHTPIKRESSGDKELHRIYIELFQRGQLPCDFMHLGRDKEFDFPLDFKLGDDDYLVLNDSIRGAILCGAIGDAMGRCVESRDPDSSSPVTWFVPWPGWKSGPIGTITDDTQMTVWLAESLLDQGRLNPEDIARRFTLERIRGVGKATRQFIGNFKDRGLPWQEAGVASAGNGAAMRAAPIGILFRNDFDELKLAAGIQAMVTHNDPMAMASSIVTAYAVARLLRMNPGNLVDIGQKTLFCRDLAESIGGIESGATRNGGVASSLAQRIGIDIPRFLDDKTEPGVVQEEFWSGAYVLESLPFALYCFLFSPGDFDRVLYNSVNESRDSDTVAAMAGTFCGALNGLSYNMDRMYWTKIKTYSDSDTIPAIRMEPEKNYLDDLEWRDELLDLADRLTKECWRE